MTADVARLTVVTGEATPGRIWRRRMTSVVAHVLLIGASILMLYPLLWMLSASFRPENEIFAGGSLIPSSVSLHGYISGWFGLSRTFGTFFVNSLTISLLCVAGNLAACSLTAFAFARLEFRGKKLWFALMLGTLMLPYQVTLIPQYVVFLHMPTWLGGSAESGWVNTFLPLVVPKFLASDSFFILSHVVLSRWLRFRRLRIQRNSTRPQPLTPQVPTPLPLKDGCPIHTTSLFLLFCRMGGKGRIQTEGPV